VFVLKYLPIGVRLEVIVWKWVLGVYHITIIGTLLPLTVIGRGIFCLGLNVYQLADSLTDSLVEIDEKVVALLEEGADIVSVVFEERALAIGTLQSIPMCLTPLVMVTDAEVFCKRRERGVFNRDGKGL
jgi:hypothetical protein